MERITIRVERRECKGKGYLKEKRRKGFIPAVLYGGGKKTEELLLSSRDLEVAFHKAKGGHIFELVGINKPESVIIKEKQVSPVKNRVIHIDFMRISEGAKVEVEVKVELIGTPEGVKDGGILEQQTHELHIKSLPSDIPEAIRVNIEGLKVGDHLYVKDIPADSRIEILEPEDKLIASLLPPKVKELPAEAVEEAEPEVITKRKKEEGLEETAE